jgi:hypothetical protein
MHPQTLSLSAGDIMCVQCVVNELDLNETQLILLTHWLDWVKQKLSASISRLFMEGYPGQYCLIRLFFNTMNYELTLSIVALAMINYSLTKRELWCISLIVLFFNMFNNVDYASTLSILALAMINYFLTKHELWCHLCCGLTVCKLVFWMSYISLFIHGR